jgi:hypothetical protein
MSETFNPTVNGIGAFAIGISSIGSQSPLNPWDTIISQYANSPSLVQIIFNLCGYLDPTALFDQFFSLIWNLDTAQGYGLDVWGRIVGVNRVIAVPTGDYFGFAEAGDDSEQPFNSAPFYSGQPSTENYPLSDDAFRTLIYAKALANISNGSSASINQILLMMLPGLGNAYVTDGLNMTMTYTFDFTLTPLQYAIVVTSGVLPKPAGVALTIVQGA